VYAHGVSSVFRNIAVVGQCALVLAGMTTLALWPPRQGAMVLVPAAGSAAGPINVALAAGASIVRAGPVAGSVVVIGERTRILDRARASGLSLVAFAAPRGLCEGALPRDVRA